MAIQCPYRSPFEDKICESAYHVINEFFGTPKTVRYTVEIYTDKSARELGLRPLYKETFCMTPDNAVDSKNILIQCYNDYKKILTKEKVSGNGYGIWEDVIE